MSDAESTSEVLVFTSRFRITGRISLLPGARLTDFIRTVGPFLAIVDVVVTTPDGREILRAPFLDLGTQHIELILPREGALLPG